MFKVRENERGFTIEMSASLGNIDGADNALARYLQDHDVDVDRFGARILLRESLLNAVIHGSGKDPEKVVRLTVELGRGRLVLTVEDAGPGFTLPAESPDVDHLGDGGRGLPLMRFYADEIDYNDAGNRVTLRKHLRPTG